MADDNYTYRGGDGSDLVNETADTQTTAFVEGVGGADDISLHQFDNVTVYGGEGAANPVDGNDTIDVDIALTALIYGNGGNDSITVDVDESASVYGGMGADHLHVTSETDGDILIYGGFGADDISASTLGDVTVYGGNGSTDPTAAERADTISVDADTAHVYGNAGDDSINVEVSTSAAVYGGLDDDSIHVDATGAGDADVVAYGGLGTDEINVFTEGDVTVYGGNGSTDPRDGADNIDVGDGEGDVFAGNVLIYGNGDDDDITAFASGDVKIFGGDGEDTIDVLHQNAGSEPDGDASDLTVHIVGGLDADDITVTTDVDATVTGGTSTDATATNYAGSDGDTISVAYTGGSDGTFHLSGSADTDNISFFSTGGIDVALTIDAGGGAEDDIEVNGHQIQFDGENYFVDGEDRGTDNTFDVDHDVTVTILNLDPADSIVD